MAQIDFHAGSRGVCKCRYRVEDSDDISAGLGNVGEINRWVLLPAVGPGVGDLRGQRPDGFKDLSRVLYGVGGQLLNQVTEVKVKVGAGCRALAVHVEVPHGRRLATYGIPASDPRVDALAPGELGAPAVGIRQKPLYEGDFGLGAAGAGGVEEAVLVP